MTPLHRIVAPAAAALLLGVLGCGGGKSSSGPSLAYTNPTIRSADFQLVQDSASTGQNLVLDLVGPSGTSGVGVTFSFKLDTSQATWGTSPAVTNGNVFSLGSGTQLAKGWVTGGQLQGIVSNKGLTGSSLVSDLSLSTSGTAGIIAKIQIQPTSGATTGTATLTDGGLGTLLDSTGGITAISVDVGTLQLQ
jgi:hypothetical protein